jgi:putative addiction module component (TIGR02574 family)
VSSRELNIQAMKLPPRGRARLAEKLLASLEDEAQRKINAEWSKEAESRIDDLDSGIATSKALGTVLRRLEARRKR